jgi:hypothetical protein
MYFLPKNMSFLRKEPVFDEFSEIITLRNADFPHDSQSVSMPRNAMRPTGLRTPFQRPRQDAALRKAVADSADSAAPAPTQSKDKPSSSGCRRPTQGDIRPEAETKPQTGDENRIGLIRHIRLLVLYF